MKAEIRTDSLSVVAGGVAFWGFLAIFPAIAAVVSLWGLLADPSDVDTLVQSAGLPTEAVGVLRDYMTGLASTSSGTLGWSAVLSVVVAIWSANKGTKAAVQALNLAYNEDESRGFIRLNALTLGLTFAAVLGFMVAAACVIAVPAMLDTVGLGSFARTAIDWLRWPVLATLMLGGLAVLYRYGPSRDEPKWRWISVGSLVATVLWIAGSLLFSFYVRHFGKYDEGYGSLGAVAILLLWFYITSFVVLLGAEINAESEHQTARDSTVGEPVPMGQRNAYHADHVAGPRERGEPRQRRGNGYPSRDEHVS